MKIFSTTRRPPPGYALIVVLVSLSAMLVVFVSILFWASSNAKNTTRNNIFNSAEFAAESATETIVAAMMRDFNYQGLNTASTYSSMFPQTNGWPVYYQFSDTNGDTSVAATVTMGTIPTTSTALGSQFSGLYGFAQPCEIASRATPLGVGYNLSATAYQMVQFALIPVFQFAIFYNMDLEINPGAAMNINGHVHSNNNLFSTGSSAGSPLTFGSFVEASGTISNSPSPYDPQNTGRSGNVVYSNATNNPLANTDSLTLPLGSTTNNNPTNVLAILTAPPAAWAPPNYSAAYSTNGLIYLANAADLIVTNSIKGTNGTFGTNITVFYQNPNNSPNYLVQVPGDVLVASNVTAGVTNVLYAYSFVTNAAFYDYRESNTVQAVQIDVARLNTWLANTNPVRGGKTYNLMNNSGSTSKGHNINSIYVYNSAANTASQMPAVRMINGQQLPASGLTVVTAAPMYVKGDYNTTTNGSTFSLTLGDTTNTAPAALIADAITIQSSSWSDANTASTLLSLRNAATTVINAAALEGIVASDGSHYSGGVENFLRLLEDWSGDNLVYNGSIVVMFPSQIAVGYWQSTGNYYNAPTRKWGFDLNFNQASRLPPLTPMVRAIIRNKFFAY